MKRILVFILFFIIVVCGVQYFTYSYTNNFFEGILVNFISDAVILVVTIFILDRLIKQHNTKVDKKLKRGAYIEALKRRHEILVTQLEGKYIHFITKFPSSSDQKIEVIMDEIDEHIGRDFMRKGYQQLVIDKNSIFDQEVKEISYEEFCSFFFKKNVEEIIGVYISRYVSIVPSEVLVSLFKIEDAIKANILTVPLDHGIVMGNFIFPELPKDKQEELKEPLKEIGEEIVKLKQYI